MVLPVAASRDGEVAADYHDERIPTSVRIPGDPWGDFPARPVGHYQPRPGCENGRHLFDVLESAADVYRVEADGTEISETAFHARLTCVRCGLIRDWQGIQDDSAQPHPVDPVPLTIGQLTAQQTRGADSWGSGERWAVHAAGERIGVIERDRTPRGRVRFVGRLDWWAQGTVIDGASPVAALRALGRKLASESVAAVRTGS